MTITRCLTMISRTAEAKRASAISRLFQWIESSGNKTTLQPLRGEQAPTSTLISSDPATGKALVQFKETTTDELDKIISAAKLAQQSWFMIPPLDRSKIMHDVAALVRKEADWLAEIEVLDTGKPLWEALADINACADSIDMFAGFIPTLSGTHVPVPPNPGSFYYTRREPFGVCAGIGAWNFPFQMAVWKSAPALAAGNAMVFKPSPLTPLTASRLAELYVKGGCPDNLFSVVLGGNDLGQSLVNHPLISKVSFTGSVAGGRAVLSSAAKRIIPGTVELGGKSALIIMADADLDEAVKGTLMANFYTQGQVCSNAARVFVHKSILGGFQQKLLDVVKSIHVGDPFCPTTSMGALITAEHKKKVQDYIQGAISQGATLSIGGEEPSFPNDSVLASGHFLMPCILTNCNDSMTAVKEEIFGPVVTLLSFETEDEVIQRVNNSELGLAGGVFTENLASAHRIAALMECGSVYVNSYNMYPPGIPFGGYKQSGFGRENSLETLNSYTQIKAVYVEGGKLPYPFPS